MTENGMAGTEIKIKERLAQSEKVLVGLGEEFDRTGQAFSCPEYARGRKLLEEAGCLWLLPEWDASCCGKAGGGQAQALEKLSALLEGKDYFVVSTAVNGRLFQGGRIVMPCGSGDKKQCAGGCGETLLEVEEEDREKIARALDALWEGECAPPRLGVCPHCGGALVLNNVRAEHYNENGYLGQWAQYRKWLQGTLNRSLLVLELGVGMEFPTVVRWPFEKTAYFNKKAFFVRVHEKLYQLTKELAGKGCGISQNAIDWLNQL